MLRDERGMTLPELLVAIVVGMIVALAAFSLVEVTMRRTGLTSNRIEGTQAGRMAMDTITREVRSQVCVRRSDGTPAMVAPRAVYAATDTSIAFFVDLSDGSQNPQLRTLSFENNQLIERDYLGTLDPGTVGATATYTYAGYPGTPSKSKVLLDNVRLGSFPTYFQYFNYDANTPPQPDNPIVAGPGLDAQTLGSIAKISVSFTSYARNATPEKNKVEPGVTFTDDVFVRSADPNSTTPRPMCE